MFDTNATTFPTTVFQPSLFTGGLPVAIGTIGDGLVRHELSDGAWLDVRPALVTGSDDLFIRLRDEVPWQADERWMYDRVVAVPRLVAHYGVGETLPAPLLGELRGRLSDHYGGEPGGIFATTGLCLYRDGGDSVSWHGDRIGRGADEDVVVAILSLGSTRRFLLRPRDGGRSLRFDLEGGDLLVMGGSCQRTWDHAVPKRAASGARISVQFRPMGAA